MNIYGKLQDKNKNINVDREEKLELGLSYLKESHWIHTEIDTRLETSGFY
jgi:hypothetical protein